MSNFDDDYLRWYLRQQELIRRMEAVNRVRAPLALAEAARKAVEEHERVRRSLQESLLGPTQQTEQIQLAHDAQRLLDLHGTAVRLVEEEQHRWEAIRHSLALSPEVSRLIRHLTTTSPLAWQASLQTLAEQMHVRYPRGWSTALERSLLAPAFGYSRFARQSLERAATAPQREAEALQASVVLAEAQLATGTQLVAAAIGPNDNVRSETPDQALPVGIPSAPEQAGDPLEAGAVVAQGAAAGALFIAQQDELLTRGATASASYAELLQLSPAAQTTASARGVTELVVRINQACRFIGRDEIFPPTTAMLRSVSDLSYLHVGDRITLGVGVDALYVLLYEGSGEAKRLLEWLPEDACEALWALKQLRNVWLRHDPAHGGETAQAKKWVKLRNALEHLGVSALPADADTCRTLYDLLLRALSTMLTSLHLAIRAKRW